MNNLSWLGVNVNNDGIRADWFIQQFVFLKSPSLRGNNSTFGKWKAPRKTMENSQDSRSKSCQISFPCSSNSQFWLLQDQSGMQLLSVPQFHRFKQTIRKLRLASGSIWFLGFPPVFQEREREWSSQLSGGRAWERIADDYESDI